MYHRKQYQGTITSATATAVVAAETGNFTTYKNQTDVLCNAMKDILTECGCVVTYEDYMLSIDGCGVYLYFVNSTGWFFRARDKAATITYISSPSYSPFSGVKYNFYITVKGEPKGCMEIYIGQYSVPAATSYGLQWMKGKYLKTDKNAVAFSAIEQTAMYLRDEEGKMFDNYTATFDFVAPLLVNDIMTENNNVIPIIQTFTSDGFFVFDNCYIRHPALTKNNFYSFRGEVFFIANDNIMTKCITEVVTTQEGGQ